MNIVFFHNLVCGFNSIPIFHSRQAVWYSWRHIFHFDYTKWHWLAGLELATLKLWVGVPSEPLDMVKMEDMSSAISYSLPAMKDRNTAEIWFDWYDLYFNWHLCQCSSNISNIWLYMFVLFDNYEREGYKWDMICDMIMIMLYFNWHLCQCSSNISNIWLYMFVLFDNCLFA
jgi:hypothetical protein